MRGRLTLGPRHVVADVDLAALFDERPGAAAPAAPHGLLQTRVGFLHAFARTRLATNQQPARADESTRSRDSTRSIPDTSRFARRSDGSMPAPRTASSSAQRSAAMIVT